MYNENGIPKWVYICLIYRDNIESERRLNEKIKTLLNHILLALKCKILSDKQCYDAQIRNPKAYRQNWLLLV